MASVLLKFIPVHEKTIYEVALTVNYLECRVEMLVQVNKNTNTLMLAILHYLDSCVFCIYRLCHNDQTKSVQSVPTVLYWVLMASGTSFVQSLLFKKKHTFVQDVYSNHRCVLALFSTVALYSSGLHCVAKKSNERSTWHKDQFSFKPV